MFKKIRTGRWSILLAVVIILAAVVGGCKIMFGNFVSIRGQHLNSFSYSSGGGMEGGYRQETVKRYDERALICMEAAQWHSQDPTVTEYLTDAAVLDELEAIVRKHRMNFWNRKKFTNLFVADGESESYYFAFDDNDISFSSQIYPTQYRKKLNELDDIIQKYIEAGEKLPGLVNTRADEEESYLLPEGESVIYVCSYALDSLGVKILNGTEEELTLSDTFQLVNADTGEVLLADETPCGSSVSPQSGDALSIRLQERLSAGSYALVFGELTLPFEIR